MEGCVEAALRELVAARKVFDSLESALVVRGRLNGATWSELGEPLGLSKQAVRKRHLAIDPIFARRAHKVPTIAEYHAELVAALRKQGVFLE